MLPEPGAGWVFRAVPGRERAVLLSSLSTAGLLLDRCWSASELDDFSVTGLRWVCGMGRRVLERPPR